MHCRLYVAVLQLHCLQVWVSAILEQQSRMQGLLSLQSMATHQRHLSPLLLMRLYAAMLSLTGVW